ncbi:MAG: hypothetical protein JO325_09510 [Solirubrobacterales bacterium]|nr:hypothetical protein [Solirubrobacterales bacterium]
MLTGHGGRDSSTARIALDNYPTGEDPDGAGLYLTNDVFLYRVVRIVASDVGAMVEVEDCYALDVVRVPIHDFHASRLRIVTASPA